MKILITSHFYFPGVGGVERFSWLMADAFARQGHEVVVMTETLADPGCDKSELFKVLRQPSPLKIIKMLKWCDVYWQNSISLRHLWLNLMVKKPAFITFQGPIGQNKFVKWLKYYFMQRYRLVSVSNGISVLLEGLNHLVIHNAFKPGNFKKIIETADREGHLVFVGRLIKEKGVDIVLKALQILRQKGQNLSFCIIGSGAEDLNLKTMAMELGISDQISFKGQMTGEELTREINNHQVMIVPSNYPEAFGIVALEGIACGCPVIASDKFGLPEAVGPCGLLFEMGNHIDCAEKIALLVDNFDLQNRLLSQRDSHLKLHSAEYIAGRYLDLFVSPGLNDLSSPEQPRPETR